MNQKGFILIVSLVFLVIMTLLALAMFSGFTQDETISSNQREKSRANDAAQSALNNAESWMNSSSSVAAILTANTSGVACTGTYTLATMQVCNQPLSAASAVLPLQWPSTATVSAVPQSLVFAAGGIANSYAEQPQVYVAYLQNNNTNPPSALIQVTASAQGGNSTATSIVQAVYQVTAASRNIGGN